MLDFLQHPELLKMLGFLHKLSPFWGFCKERDIQGPLYRTCPVLTAITGNMLTRIMGTDNAAFVEYATGWSSQDEGPSVGPP